MTTQLLVKYCLVTASLLALTPCGYTQPQKGKVRKTSAAQTASAQNWQPNPGLLKQLAPEVSLGDYGVRPPQGYQLDQEPKEGDGYTLVRYRWKGNQRPDHTRPAFVVTIVSAGLNYHPANEEKSLTATQASIESKLHDYAQSQSEEGNLHDIDFARIYWKGTGTKPETRLHGFTYKGVDSFTVISIISEDGEPYHKSTLAVMEAAAETFRRK